MANSLTSCILTPVLTQGPPENRHSFLEHPDNSHSQEYTTEGQMQVPLHTTTSEELLSETIMVGAELKMSHITHEGGPDSPTASLIWRSNPHKTRLVPTTPVPPETTEEAKMREVED